ncbi:extracellular solute-binding protein [Kiloniella sp.]|uniref:extracellular solute-binding protein n=1 Tax=Kiloniella sp. TaxID=1938587 RepID=UPI003B01704E
MNKAQNKLAVALVSVSILAVSGCVTTERDPNELVVVSWGGTYGLSQQKAYVEPFKEIKPGLNIQITQDSRNALKSIRKQVRQKNIKWDVVDMLHNTAKIACDEGLLEEININKDIAPAPDGTPANQDFYKILFPDVKSKNCFAPLISYSVHFAYPTNQWGNNQPASITDIFNLKKFPGKRGLEKTPYNNMEWALLADGVPMDQVYDLLSTGEGVERAFNKLDTIKDNIIWWEAGVQPIQFLEGNHVAISSIYNGRSYEAEFKHNLNISLMWDWQALGVDGWAIPKGTPNLQLAKEFVRYSSSTSQLADQASYISYGPARRSSLPLVGNNYDNGHNMRPYMTTSPERMLHAFVPDPVSWEENRDRMNRLFNWWL